MRPPAAPRPEARRRARVPFARPRTATPRRANTLLEAVVFMAIISVTVAGFAIAAASMLGAQREQHGLDIASQAAHGQIEKAKSLAWTDLGFAATDGAPASFGGKPTVVLTGPASGERLTHKSSVVIKGLTVNLTTNVTWDTLPPAGNPEYGTKRVTVTVTWQPAGEKTHTATFSDLRTSQANEAPPTPLPSDFGPPVPSNVPTPTANPSGTATTGLGE